MAKRDFDSDEVKLLELRDTLELDKDELLGEEDAEEDGDADEIEEVIPTEVDKDEGACVE